MFSDAVAGLIRRAETVLPSDVVDALEGALQGEEDEIARIQLDTILKNIRFAGEKKIPLCQDTGLLKFYVGFGSASGVDLSSVLDSLVGGVRLATREIPLRPNSVHPLTRKNSGDNTGRGVPSVELEFLPGGDYVEVTVFPKGAGSENMTFFRMLGSSAGAQGIKEFVLECVSGALGNPCPPVIVGVGVGGLAEDSLKLSKRALLRRVGSRNPEEEIAELERSLLADVNKLGIGPMGLGGKTTALAVNIEYAFCHTASLPVAVSLGCWATRRATMRIYDDRVEYL